MVALFPLISSASPVSVAVIYPEVAPPYNTILLQIIEGINQKFDVKVREYRISNETDTSTLRKQLDDKNTEVIISLGRRGVEVMQTLEWKKPVVIGAVSLTPELVDAYRNTMNAIRLTPDPELLFSRLRELSPQAKRIVVITSARKDSWLLMSANDAARKNNFELVVHEALDIRAAANLYSTVMESMKPDTDVLWLPPDDESFDIRNILPVILQSSWDRRIVVFCSNPAHVKRGALFALYPDNKKMGNRLATLAMEAVKSGGSRIFPAQDVFIAVNVRTADHLGLSKITRRPHDFDVVYPAQ